MTYEFHIHNLALAITYMVIYVKIFQFLKNLNYETLLIPSISNANSIAAPDWVSLDTFASKVSIRKNTVLIPVKERICGSRIVQKDLSHDKSQQKPLLASCQAWTE